MLGASGELIDRVASNCNPNMSRRLKPLWDYEHASMICTQRVFVNVNNHVFLLRSYP
jgi:hypothetical protein